MFEFDAKVLFRQRLSRHLKELSRYLRYIFNGHIAFALLFFISALAYYYRGWLENLPEQFPSALVIGVIFGMIASFSRVHTLLQQPDLVFLLPAEHKMWPYFWGTFAYSFLSQLYLVLLAAAALGPLYFASNPGRPGSTYLFMILVLFIFKAWNLASSWWMCRSRDGRIRRTEQIMRLLLNVLVFYLFAKGEMVLAGAATIVFIVLFLWVRHWAGKQPGIHWELLVEKDLHSMQSFYRFANLFTDVPHLASKVRRRDWLSVLFKNAPFEQRASYDYLYRLTFIRSGDYFGMYARLIVIGALAIWFVPNLTMKLLFVLLFLYMSLFQMMPLYSEHRTVLWIELYPVKESVRLQALLHLMMRLALVQTVLFALVFFVLGLWLQALITLAGGVLFSYVFINGYIRNKLKRESLARQI